MISLTHSGAYVSAFAQSELNRIKPEVPANIFKLEDPPYFQSQVANGQLEKPKAIVALKFDIGDNIFAERFVIMKNLTGPIIGLHFIRHNIVVIDTINGLIHFPHLTMQAKNSASEARANSQTVLTHKNTQIPPMKTKTNRLFVDYPSEWHTIGTVTPVEKFTEASSLLISHSVSTIIDKKIAIRITNATV